MNDESRRDHQLDSLADDFVARYRRGEHPALTEYCQRFPELAGDIRQLFPTLVTMEQARPDDDPTVASSVRVDGTTSVKLERLGDYRILREIARGGMGIVYEAEQESLGRHVALKILPPQAVLDPQHLQRFQREARAAARLHHTNIVPVFGVGESDGVHYYVMQFIHGLGLDQVLEEVRRLRSDHPATSSRTSGRGTDDTSVDSATLLVRSPALDGANPGVELPVRDSTSLLRASAQYWQSVARIGVQVAEALDYAFTQGVLHRDIKPSNLLLDVHGIVWVTDFGLAKSADSTDLTHTGDVVGTLKYLAPERLRGEVSIRGDIYSLGATLYEMLTLRPPFQDLDRSRLLRRITDEEPVRPRDINGDIPPDLETIVLKSMAKDPEDRYQTAAELANDLRHFLEDKPIRARPIGQWERGWRWCRRNPRIATLTATVATLLVAVAVISTLAAIWLRKERDAARQAEQMALAAVAKQEQAEVAQRRELFRAYLQDSQSLLLTGRMGQRTGGLQAVSRILAVLPDRELTPLQKAELRDAAIAHLALPDCREVDRLNNVAFHRGAVAIDDALQLVAASSEEGANTVIRRLGDPEFRVELEIDGPDQGQYMTHRLFSPSGRWLAEYRHKAEKPEDRQLVVWDWREKRIVYRDEHVAGARLEFHPDDRHLLWEKRLGFPRVVDVTTGQIVRESPRSFFRGWGAAFPPDGRWLAICSPDITSEIVSSDTWQTVVALPSSFRAQSVAWHPRDAYAVFGSSYGELFVARPENSSGQYLAPASLGGVDRIAFSPEGEYLAYSQSTNRSEIRLTDNERMRIRLPGQFQRFGRDGRRIALRLDEHTLTINEVIFPRALWHIPRIAEAAEFSADGRWLVSGGAGGVHLYSTQSWQEVADLKMDTCGPVAWHPDGRGLATFGIFSQAQLWPIGPLPDRPDQWQIGPPRALTERTDLDNLAEGKPLAPHHFGRHVAFSRDGRVLAIADARRNQIWMGDAGGERPPQVFAPFAAVRRVALSPQGEWIAASAHLGVRHTGVFRVSDRQQVLELKGHGNVAFSSDGEYFASCSVSECRIYRVGTWKLERTLPILEMPNWDASPVAFQPQGELLAIADSVHRTRLYHRGTGQNVANLTHSRTEASHGYWLSFSPDGTRLALTRIPDDICVWDLAELRAELAECGIAVPELPARRENGSPRRERKSEPLVVDRGPKLPLPEHWYRFWTRLARGEENKGQWPDAIDDLNSALRQPIEPLGRDRAEILDQRGADHLRNGDSLAARNDWREAVSLVPDLDDTTRRLARLELIGPRVTRDFRQALARLAPLASKPDAPPEDRMLFGIALVRIGHFEQGATALHSIADAPAAQPLAPLFLALALGSLGRHDQAKASYDRAAEWLQQHPSEAVEYRTAADEVAEQLRP